MPTSSEIVLEVIKASFSGIIAALALWLWLESG